MNTADRIENYLTRRFGTGRMQSLPHDSWLRRLTGKQRRRAFKKAAREQQSS